MLVDAASYASGKGWWAECFALFLDVFDLSMTKSLW